MTLKNNKKTNCIIRADGGFKIGHGHLKRCFALCELLRDYYNIYFFSKNIPKYIKNDFNKICTKVISLPKMSQKRECEYIFTKLEDFKLIIIDGYNFNYNYEKFFYKRNKKVITIDDVFDRNYCSHAIINHAPLVSKNNYKNLTSSKLYLGLEYKIIQKCFYQDKIVDRSILKNNIFVCLGSGTANYSLKVKLVRLLLKITNIDKIYFVTSRKNIFLREFKSNKNYKKLKIFENIGSNDIAKLVKKSRFGICTASNISLECYTANLPLLLTYSADNHLNVYKGLIRSKVAIGIGNLKELNAEKFKISLNKIQKKDFIKKFISISKKSINLSSRKKLLSALLL